VGSCTALSADVTSHEITMQHVLYRACACLPCGPCTQAQTYASPVFDAIPPIHIPSTHCTSHVHQKHARKLHHHESRSGPQPHHSTRIIVALIEHPTAPATHAAHESDVVQTQVPASPHLSSHNKMQLHTGAPCVSAVTSAQPTRPCVKARMCWGAPTRPCVNGADVFGRPQWQPLHCDALSYISLPLREASLIL
jgi:hypothetical protein